MSFKDHLPPPPGLDSEAGSGEVRPESNFRGVSDVQKWRREDWMKKGALAFVFRAITLLFSFLTFMLVVTISSFTLSADASYIFSISLIVMIYTAVVVGIKGHELRTGDVVIPPTVALWINFCGDQILAIMLISSASSATSSITNNMYFGYREIEKVKGAVAMAFIGFFSLECAALISGYNLSVHLFTS